ncbi:MAG TPA: hydrogenase maturation nickel metallochaperone HypA [Acidimicrobiia bacterium]
MMMRTEVAERNMHEQELMAEVLETLQSLADAEFVGEVEIALGPGVDREDAERAWETLTEDTPLAGAHVVWEQALDLLRCGDCGHEYTGDRLDSCPYCGGDGVVIEPTASVSLGRWVGATV